MSVPPQSPWTPPPRERMGAGRVIAVVLGVLLYIPALALLAGGGLLLWADATDRTDGFLLLFESVSDAACYAVAYHRALAANQTFVPSEILSAVNPPPCTGSRQASIVRTSCSSRSGRPASGTGGRRSPPSSSAFEAS